MFTRQKSIHNVIHKETEKKSNFSFKIFFFFFYQAVCIFSEDIQIKYIILNSLNTVSLPNSFVISVWNICAPGPSV